METHGDEMPLEKLSSGEKQLIIMLGESLLQEQSECVYFADEPEISLHISWQESLVNDVLRLNPNVQLILATHSPDIVSIYSDNAIDISAITR